MMASPPVVRFGTRGSALARRQTEYVRALLQAAWPHLCAQVQVISTYGDRVVDTPLPALGGKGVFTAELEAALLRGAVDLATHSLKDLPTQPRDGLAIGAVPRRANPADVLVSRGSYTLDTLPPGATVGTSSRRRAAQLLYRRPDLRIADIRGNVETRINKALDPTGPYDAVILAYAGLQRLDSLDVVCQVLALDPAKGGSKSLLPMLPAPGQGALGIQCRDEPLWLELVASINHRETAIAVTAERAFLAGLGGGCAMPIAAHATIEDDHLRLQGRVTAPDGTAEINLSATVPLAGCVSTDLCAAHELGRELAHAALQQGAVTLLEAAT